jgi:hypothetical protein
VWIGFVADLIEVVCARFLRGGTIVSPPRLYPAPLVQSLADQSPLDQSPLD